MYTVRCRRGAWWIALALWGLLGTPGALADTKINSSSQASSPQATPGPNREWIVHFNQPGIGWFIARLDDHANLIYGPRVAQHGGIYPFDGNVAWNGSNVGWTYRYQQNAQNYSEIWFHLIEPGGPVASTPVYLSPASEGLNPCCPDVHWAENEFTIGWTSQAGVTTRRVAAGGQPVSAELLVSSLMPGSYPRFVQVAMSSGRIGVAWVENGSTDSVWAAWVDSAGNPIGGPVECATAAPNCRLQTRQATAWRDGLTVIFASICGNTHSLFQVEIAPGGSSVGVPMLLVDLVPNYYHQATSAPAGHGIVFGHYDGSAGQIYLRRVSRDAKLTSKSLRVTDIPYGALGTSNWAAFQGRSYGVAWLDNREGLYEKDLFFDVAPAYEVLAVGAGPSPASTPQVDLLQPEDPTGPVVTSITPYAAGGYGANVGAGEIDGQGADNLLMGPGPGDVYGPQVRAFSWKGIPQPKVNFFAYGTLKYGVKAQGGDLDGDGISEILTGAGPGEVFGPHVRGWNFDGTKLESIQKVNFFAYQTLKYGVNAIGADIDGDTYSEILTGPGPSPLFGSHLRGFDYDGSAVAGMASINRFVFPGSTDGLELAGGDTDWDGVDELAVAAGPHPLKGSEIALYDYDGSALNEMTGSRFEAFSGSIGGARLSFCQWWDADINRELVISRGPLPANSSEVAAFDDSSTTFAPLTTFDPYPGQDHGSTLTSIFVGF